MYKQLTEPQRYEIYLGLKRKWSKSRIACEIGVSASTVSREVRRNADPSGEYVWTRAQSRCVRRRHGLPGGARQGLPAVVACGAYDSGRGVVSRSSGRRTAQGGDAHLQADHLQPRARRPVGTARRPSPAPSQIQQADAGASRDQGHQHRGPHKHT